MGEGTLASSFIGAKVTEKYYMLFVRKKTPRFPTATVSRKNPNVNFRLFVMTMIKLQS